MGEKTGIMDFENNGGENTKKKKKGRKAKQNRPLRGQAPWKKKTPSASNRPPAIGSAALFEKLLGFSGSCRLGKGETKGLQAEPLKILFEQRSI